MGRSELDMPLSTILDQLRAAFEPLNVQIEAGSPPGALRLRRSARLPALAALYAIQPRPTLLLTDRADHALALYAVCTKKDCAFRPK